MNAKAFQVINAINCEGLYNHQWGMCQDIEDTTMYFGTIESVKLDGRFAYVYRPVHEEYSFFKGIKADYSFRDCDGTQMIDIYKM